MKCYYHPDVDAVATCVNCGKAICQTCAVNVSGRIICQRCLATGAVTRAPATAKPYNPVALVSLALGILGLLGCFCGGGIGGLLFGVPATITGYIARRQLAEHTDHEGMPLANIGLGLGAAETGLSVVALLIFGGYWGLAILTSLLQQSR
jgi:hypothetical protein